MLKNLESLIQNALVPVLIGVDTGRFDIGSAVRLNVPVHFVTEVLGYGLEGSMPVGTAQVVNAVVLELEQALRVEQRVGAFRGADRAGS